MQNSLIDYSADVVQKGYRLQRLEVFNWGTFDKKVWKIEPDGANSLLTGDIGSGKSTLVDAILTLLVPHNKIIYNKAAGAETRERTLSSYVLGEHKYQRSEYSSDANPVYLRGVNDYSVILARFHNKGYNTGLTLAQVFWMKSTVVEKFFVVTDLDINIKDNFSLLDGEKDVTPLKKRIKKFDKTEVFEQFKDYSANFRRKFGIKDEKVLELFYQTVSMKSIGNLTDFMRNHMLEKFDVADKVNEIMRNYENLRRSHEAVQNAKKQIEQLTPLIDEIEKYRVNIEKLEESKKCLVFLPTYFAELKRRILEEEIFRHDVARTTLVNQIGEIITDLERLGNRKDDLTLLVSQNTLGQRINQLEAETVLNEGIKQNKIKAAEEYSRLCEAVELTKPFDEQTFQEVTQKAVNLRESFDSENIKLTEQRDEILTVYRNLRDQWDNDQKELASLEKRKSNIPERNLEVRNLILNNLEIEESELPFVGELLQVKSSEKNWEGAIERVLHNFGLSILVAERFYKEISNFVDKTNLKGRIVYYKVPQLSTNVKIKDTNGTSLVKKIDINTSSEFYHWIENELKEKYDYSCCESIEQFQRELKAITKNGQIKGVRGRHEKDDLKNILDRRNYVLGWNNQEKIKRINQDMESAKSKIATNQKSKEDVEGKQKRLQSKLVAIHDLLKYRNYLEINWKKEAENIETLTAEIEQLKKSSDELKTLKDQLNTTVKEIEKYSAKKTTLDIEQGKLNQIIINFSENLEECKRQLESYPFEKGQDLLPLLNEFTLKQEFKIKTIDSDFETVRKIIMSKIDEIVHKDRKIRENIVKKMLQFKYDFPEATMEIIPGIEEIGEFETLFEKLRTEDLPKYEDRFKRYLNEGTINDIVMFKTQLTKNSDEIKKKIKAINGSLKKIEYSNNTYIALSLESVHDADIKEFQGQLRDCLENTYGEENLYNEDKFNRVKKILDRFGSGSLVDLNWTKRVTDVRNWFNFSAIEKYLADDTEKEFYSDSSGKSGGQKEKLAYTILASALAYQFGMVEDQPKSKSFRFVMIDEAFGRGSDESTSYGLNLFKKLELQLLIITPLQKIHVIENYINYVHFVSNENGNNSMTRDIPIEEYQKTKKIQSV